MIKEAMDIWKYWTNPETPFSIVISEIFVSMYLTAKVIEFFSGIMMLYM